MNSGTETHAGPAAGVSGQNPQSDPSKSGCSLSRESACWEALRTAIVLAERELLPGPRLIEEWKQVLPNVERTRSERQG